MGWSLVFFFQAEDGIRYKLVTGVQTCALPIFPVVRGERETVRQIVLYSVVLLGVTLLPWAAGGAGPFYVVAALALGGAFVWLAERLRRDTSPRRAALLFHYSLLYLALLFAALALDLAL